MEEKIKVDDALGDTVERLEETFKGIKVYDTVVTVRKTKAGRLTGDASGILFQNIEEDLPDTKPVLSSIEALHIVLFYEGDDVDDVGEIKVKQYIYIDENDEDKAKLVYIVSYLVDGFKRPFYILNANSGTVLKKWDGLNSYPCCQRDYLKAVGGNEKMGKITYGDMPYCLAMPAVNGTCYLENQYVRVVDMKQTNFSNITDTVSFDCDLGYHDEINGGFAPAIDAFFHGTVVGKLFEDWFGGAPLKSKIVLRVHYHVNFSDAFWNGDNCTFGDGGDEFYPLTSLDVVGHEVGHGITEQASELAYYGEHGGVNEAFSDIMGEVAEAYLAEADFLTGGKIMKIKPYLREFEIPENDNKSISKVSDMNQTMNVHYSSGVFRRVWYVVVKQEGMSIRDTSSVFLHANKMYWHSMASFYDCACGLLMAAIDLGFPTLPLNKAFSDVGLEHCDVESHILGLNNNKTVTGVTVSVTINPVFKMKTPEWADIFLVDITSGASANWVWISVFRGGWDNSSDACGEEKGVSIAEGFDHVRIPDSADKTFYMKFSVPKFEFDSVSDNTTRSNSSLSDIYKIDIIAGYTCQLNFTTDKWMYKHDCGLDWSGR